MATVSVIMLTHLRCACGQSFGVAGHPPPKDWLARLTFTCGCDKETVRMAPVHYASLHVTRRDL